MKIRNLALPLVLMCTCLLVTLPTVGAEARAKRPVAGANMAPPPGTMKAPAFTLTSIDGSNVSLDRYQGRVKIINFWATWCPPCREEIPSFVALQTRYRPRGLEIIGLSIDRDPEVVKAFAKANGINYACLMANETIQQAYGGIRSIPTTFLVGKRGYVFRKYQGSRSAETFEADLTQLL